MYVERMKTMTAEHSTSKYMPLAIVSLLLFCCVLSMQMEIEQTKYVRQVRLMDWINSPKNTNGAIEQ
jgi:hypothetical protein